MKSIVILKNRVELKFSRSISKTSLKHFGKSIYNKNIKTANGISNDNTIDITEINSESNKNKKAEMENLEK
jgi:hypothetical protein